MKVGDGACEPVQEAGAVVPEFLGDLTADEGNGEAAAGAGLREGMEPDGVRGKVQAEDFGHAWDGGGAKLEEGHGACGGLDVGGDGVDGGVWGGEVTDMGEEADGVSIGIECYIKFCLSTTGILRLPDKRLPDGRSRLPASGRHCGMRIFISAIGRRLCVPGPLLCRPAGACVFLAWI